MQCLLCLKQNVVWGRRDCFSDTNTIEFFVNPFLLQRRNARTARKSIRRQYLDPLLFGLILCLYFPILLVAQQKVVGYYASWKSGVLPYDNVGYSHLTHINVAFIFPLSDGSIGSLAGGIPFPQLMSTAHTAGKKVLIAVGGASNSGSFAAATATSATRGVLIDNIVSFLQTNNYDGIDIDWEVPANSVQTAQLTALVQEMRAKFNQVNSSWLITMAVPPTHYGGQHFDYANLVNHVDWFNLMCYDFYGSWSGYAGHNSPLYQHPGDPTQAGADSESVAYMVSRGVPKPKLVLGIPFYGVQFIAPGLYQKMSNTLVSNPLYQDIVNSMTSGWVYRWDEVSKVPYVMNADSTQFITFEDTTSVKLKVAFSIRQQLAGVMIWELSQGLLNNGSQPLLEAIGKAAGLLTTVEEPASSSDRALLYDNYPNPFNSETVIWFSIPVASPVSLTLFDVSGREIAVLLDERRSAGLGSVRFDASGFQLSSGVYFYRLAVENELQTKKFVLVR